MNECQYIQCNKETKTKYCSFSCGTKQQYINNPVKKQENWKTCIRDSCEKTFNAVYTRKESIYCSRSCAATVNNEARTKWIVCPNCEKQTKSKKFCSIQCAATYNSKIKIDSWLSGKWDGSSKGGLSASIRAYIIEQADFKCVSPNCAVPGGFKTIHSVTNRCPLEVDHIDGDCYNNTRENLIVLCPNCHSLTPNYRSLNKNSKRTYRKKYYRPASDDFLI